MINVNLTCILKSLLTTAFKGKKDIVFAIFSYNFQVLFSKTIKKVVRAMVGITTLGLMY